jgi:hypothetical protein
MYTETFIAFILIYIILNLLLVTKSKNREFFGPAVFVLIFNNLFFNIPEYLNFDSISNNEYLYRKIFIIGIYSEFILIALLIIIINKKHTKYNIQEHNIINDDKLSTILIFLLVSIIFILSIKFNFANILDPRYLISHIRKYDSLSVNIYQIVII